MNFAESISNYVLGNLTTKDLPNIGLIALSENIESESLYILAGMSEKDNSFEILQYFDSSLTELNIQLPSKTEASKVLAKYYLNQIIQNPNSAFEIMARLDTYVYGRIAFQDTNRKYFGEELKIEHLYTWYREIQDWINTGTIFYYNELNREEQRKKFEEHLVEEAKISLQNNYS